MSVPAVAVDTARNDALFGSTPVDFDMRRAPERPWYAQVLTLFAAFLGGPLASVRLAMRLVPASGFIQAASGFLFALAFVAASLTWTGFGFLSATIATIRRSVRAGRLVPLHEQPGEMLVPTGYGVYVPFCTTAGFIIGLLAGIVTELPLGVAVVVWSCLGAVYGILLRAAAHHGFLPFLVPG